MPPAVAAMVRFQWLTGCRPQDACHLRAEDLDRSGPGWVYRPARHKTAWRGRPREVYVGPKAQAVLAPWLGGPGYAFSPARAVERFHAGRSAGRATPRYPSHLRRTQSKRTPSPRRPPRDRYTTGSYCKAVARACKAAGVEPFSPGQLRHNAGTRFRGRYGLEVARVLLGHGQTTTTELYAEKPRRLAMDAMRQAG
jgi:integrase